VKEELEPEGYVLKPIDGKKLIERIENYFQSGGNV